jgi:hypothetical protein
MPGILIPFNARPGFWGTWHMRGLGNFIGLSPRRGQGAIVLTDAANGRGIKDLGMHLINQADPLVPER